MRLSVCIVTYNHAEFIETCLRSALTQETDFDYEVVVGDDKSTDDTALILRRLEREFPDRLRVIYRPHNIGAAENFEDTIASCKGTYIAFLEGDNFWTSPHKIQQQVDMLAADPTLSFCFHRVRSLEADPETPEHLVPPQDPPARTGFDFLMQPGNPVALGSMVIPKALLADLPRWTKGLHVGDWAICMMLARHGPFGYIPLEMSRQRMHQGGSWTARTPHMRYFYTIEMFHQAVGLLDGQEAAMARARLEQFTAWWVEETLAGRNDSLTTCYDELARIDKPDLTLYLLRSLTDHGIADIAELAPLRKRDRRRKRLLRRLGLGAA